MPNDNANAHFFLVIEGMDGSGKSSVSRRLCEFVRDAGYTVEHTHEPYEPAAGGEFCRQVLRKERIVHPRTLALAFALNRADHNDSLINPFLAAGGGRILVCDRYDLSSLVYQSSDAVPMSEVRLLNRLARRPDLTLFLDASPSVCYQRMAGRAANRELFEQNLSERRHVYAQAMDTLRAAGDTIIEVNADGTPDEVLAAVLDALRRHAPAWLTLTKELL